MPARHQFRVVYAESVRQQFSAIVMLAAASGKKSLVLDSATAIHQDLQYQPEEFGERLYTLRDARLEVRVGGKGPLSVNFAVHTEEPIVFVKRFDLLRGPDKTGIGPLKIQESKGPVPVLSGPLRATEV
jgi:hypothetical protein